MRLLKLLFVALIAMGACCPVGMIWADSPTLDPGEAATLAYLREFSKYKWDIYRGSGAEAGPRPEEPRLLALAAEEWRRMATLKNLLGFYGIEDPVVSYDYWVYSDGFLTDDLDIRLYVNWGTRTWQFRNCAYLEEMNIRDLREAIVETDESALSETYMAMLERSYSNLVILATALYGGDPTSYPAQLLEQADVDQIMANTTPAPFEEDFVINAGLNDSWFDPATNGQGFFIAVYPDSDTIVLSWLTYDTEAPAQDADAHLGDPCQRWFMAQGQFQGDLADLAVYSSGGGIFNQGTPVPMLNQIGHMSVQFDSCNSGILTFYLPGVSASGAIPIQRVSPDNVALCEALATAVAR